MTNYLTLPEKHFNLTSYDIEKDAKASGGVGAQLLNNAVLKARELLTGIQVANRSTFNTNIAAEINSELNPAIAENGSVLTSVIINSSFIERVLSTIEYQNIMNSITKITIPTSTQSTQKTRFSSDIAGKILASHIYEIANFDSGLLPDKYNKDILFVTSNITKIDPSPEGGAKAAKRGLRINNYITHTFAGVDIGINVNIEIFMPVKAGEKTFMDALVAGTVREAVPLPDEAEAVGDDDDEDDDEVDPDDEDDEVDPDDEEYFRVKVRPFDHHAVDGAQWTTNWEDYMNWTLDCYIDKKGKICYWGNDNNLPDEIKYTNFWKGNKIKNIMIRSLSASDGSWANNNKMKAIIIYLTCKELGDSLLPLYQLELTNNGVLLPPISDRLNTYIFTSDEPLTVRSKFLNTGAVFSKGELTYAYLLSLNAADPAEFLKLTKQKSLQDAIKENTVVIGNIDALIGLIISETQKIPASRMSVSMTKTLTDLDIEGGTRCYLFRLLPKGQKQGYHTCYVFNILLCKRLLEIRKRIILANYILDILSQNIEIDWLKSLSADDFRTLTYYFVATKFITIKYSGENISAWNFEDTEIFKVWKDWVESDESRRLNLTFSTLSQSNPEVETYTSMESVLSQNLFNFISENCALIMPGAQPTNRVASTYTRGFNLLNQELAMPIGLQIWCDGSVATEYWEDPPIIDPQLEGQILNNCTWTPLGRSPRVIITKYRERALEQQRVEKAAKAARRAEKAKEIQDRKQKAKDDATAVAAEEVRIAAASTPMALSVALPLSEFDDLDQLDKEYDELIARIDLRLEKLTPEYADLEKLDAAYDEAIEKLTRLEQNLDRRVQAAAQASAALAPAPAPAVAPASEITDKEADHIVEEEKDRIAARDVQAFDDKAAKKAAAKKAAAEAARQAFEERAEAEKRPRTPSSGSISGRSRSKIMGGARQRGGGISNKDKQDIIYNNTINAYSSLEPYIKCNPRLYESLIKSDLTQIVYDIIDNGKISDTDKQQFRTNISTFDLSVDTVNKVIKGPSEYTIELLEAIGAIANQHLVQKEQRATQLTMEFGRLALGYIRELKATLVLDGVTPPSDSWKLRLETRDSIEYQLSDLIISNSLSIVDPNVINWANDFLDKWLYLTIPEKIRIPSPRFSPSWAGRVTAGQQPWSPSIPPLILQESNDILNILKPSSSTGPVTPQKTTKYVSAPAGRGGRKTRKRRKQNSRKTIKYKKSKLRKYKRPKKSRKRRPQKNHRRSIKNKNKNKQKN